MADVRREPGAERLGDAPRRTSAGVAAARRPTTARQLRETVLGALEEVAREPRGSASGPSRRRRRTPPSGKRCRRSGDAIGRSVELDARLACRLGAVVPGELAVADVVAVAMAEVDPVAVGALARCPRARRRVSACSRIDDAPAVPREDRAGDEPAERGAHDDDVGLVRTAVHGRYALAPAPAGVKGGAQARAVRERSRPAGRGGRMEPWRSSGGWRSRPVWRSGGRRSGCPRWSCGTGRKGPSSASCSRSTTGLLQTVGERSLELFLTVFVILLVVDLARRSSTRRRARQTVRPPRRRR